MEIKIRKNSDIYIVDIDGEFDLYNSYKLKELVVKMVGKNIKKIVINMEHVSYIDSSGIGVLIFIFSLFKKNGEKFFLSNVHGSVKKVIELTKLMAYFPVEESVIEAVKKF